MGSSEPLFEMTGMTSILVMREALETRRQKLLWFLRVRALLHCLFIALVCGLLLGWVDFHYRPQLSLFRYLLAISFWGPFLVAVYRYFLPLVFREIQLIDVALAMAQPEQGTAEDFAALVALEQSAKVSTVQNSWTETILKSLDRQQPADFPKVKSRWILTQFCTLIGILLMLLCLAPQRSVIAIQRLAMPARPIVWPQATQFVLLDSRQREMTPGTILTLMSTQSVQFFARDVVGAPPEEVTLEIRRLAEPLKKIRLSGSQENLPDGTPGTLFNFRLTPDTHATIQFRVVGGDDDSMPWTTLLRELKPVVQSLTCRMTAPDYLRREPLLLKNWAGELQAPLGALLSFELTLNRPVAEFLVRSSSQNELIHLKNQAEKYNFQLQVENVDENSFAYEVLVKIPQRAASASAVDNQWQRVKRIQVAPILDLPPAVSLVTPAQDTTVTPHAVLPLKATAQDDNGLAFLRIQITAIDEYSLEASETNGKLVEAFHGKLSVALTRTQPGDTIEILATAGDFSPTGQNVSTPPIQLRVISMDDKETEISYKFRQLTQALLAILKLQKDVLSDTEQLALDLEDFRSNNEFSGTLQPLQIKQQRIQDELLNRIHEETVKDLIQEIAGNRVENAELQTTILKLDQRFSQVIQPCVSELIPQLQAIRKAFHLTPEEGIPLRHSSRLLESVQHSIKIQKKAIHEISALIHELDRWVEGADLQLQWQLLRSGLVRLKEGLSELAQETVSKSLNELTTKLRTQLAESSESHVLLSTRLQEFHSDLTQAHQPHWKPVQTGLSEAGAAMSLKEAGSAIESNNVLKAIELDRLLVELLARLDEQRLLFQFNRTAGLIAELRSAKEKLESMRNQQRDLSQRWRLSSIDPTLFESQQNLGNLVEKLADRLEGLGDPEVSEQLRVTVNEIKQLLQEKRAMLPETLETNLKQVEEHLEQVSRRIEDSILRLQQPDQSQFLEELAILAREFQPQQMMFNQKYATVFKEFKKSGRVNRQGRRELLLMVEFERALVQRLQDLSQRLTGLPVVEQTLKELIESAVAVSAAIQEQRISEPLTERMEKIVTLLDQLSLLDTENSKQSSAGDLVSTQVRAQLKILLERQRQLLAEEAKLLESGDTLGAEKQATFKQQQLEILESLKEILEKNGQAE